jgi:hypothetical protein
MTTYVLKVLPKPECTPIHVELRTETISAMAPIEIHSSPRWVPPSPSRVAVIVLHIPSILHLKTCLICLTCCCNCLSRADGLPHSLLPLGISAAHLLLVGFLSTASVRTIYRSYVALPPSSATRHREPLRRGHVQAFTALAIVSLAVGCLFAATFSRLSYRVWATQRGVELPNGLVMDI